MKITPYKYCLLNACKICYKIHILLKKKTSLNIYQYFFQGLIKMCCNKSNQKKGSTILSLIMTNIFPNYHLIHPCKLIITLHLLLGNYGNYKLTTI